MKIDAHNMPIKYERTNSFSKAPSSALIMAILTILSEAIVFYVFTIYSYESQAIKVAMICIHTTSLLMLLISVIYTGQSDPTDDILIAHIKGDIQIIAQYKKQYPQKFYYCYDCKTHVKQKSRHCRACDRCIQNFDHHCIWLNTCVGGKNYKVFFAAILIVFLHLFIYLLAIAMLTEQIRVTTQNFTSAGFIITWVEGVIVSVFIFLISNLILLHIYLICKDLTTYEFILMRKQQQRRQKVIRQEQQIQKNQKEQKEKQQARQNMQNELKNRSFEQNKFPQTKQAGDGEASQDQESQNKWDNQSNDQQMQKAHKKEQNVVTPIKNNRIKDQQTLGEFQTSAKIIYETCSDREQKQFSRQISDKEYKHRQHYIKKTNIIKLNKKNQVQNQGINQNNKNQNQVAGLTTQSQNQLIEKRKDEKGQIKKINTFFAQNSSFDLLIGRNQYFQPHKDKIKTLQFDQELSNYRKNKFQKAINRPQNRIFNAKQKSLTNGITSRGYKNQKMQTLSTLKNNQAPIKYFDSKKQLIQKQVNKLQEQ